MAHYILKCHLKKIVLSFFFFKTDFTLIFDNVKGDQMDQISSFVNLFLKPSGTSLLEEKIKNIILISR